MNDDYRERYHYHRHIHYIVKQHAVKCSSQTPIETSRPNVIITTVELRSDPKNGGAENFDKAWAVRLERGSYVLLFPDGELAAFSGSSDNDKRECIACLIEDVEMGVFDYDIFDMHQIQLHY